MQIRRLDQTYVSRRRTGVRRIWLGLVASLLSTVPVWAEPTGEVVVDHTAVVGGGSAVDFARTVNVATGVDLDITQNTDRVVIDWTSFNIDATDVVNFNQAASNWIAVNRVTGGAVTPSIINGALNATGHVWILDPSGVMFGAGAVVDVGGLLASSSTIDPTAFVATDPANGSFAFTADGAGAVTNAATLEAQGLIALVAPVVTNSGTLRSANGDVLLGGAQAFHLKFVEADRTPSGGGATYKELLVTDFIIDTGVVLDPTPGSETIPVIQTATGRAEAGRVIVSAASVGGGAFLNLDGVIEANDVGISSGGVLLLGGANLTGGVVAATGTERIRTSDLGITASDTLTVQGSAIVIGDSAPGINVGAATVLATTGDVAIADAIATTGALLITAAAGDIDVGATTSGGAIALSALDIDLTGKADATGAASLTATTGNISSTTMLEVEGSGVTLSGPALGGTGVTLTATAGNVAADAVTATAGALLITAAAGDIDVGATTSGGAITLSALDIDLTGKADATGAASLTATTGDISSTTMLEVEGSGVTLSGPALGGTGVTLTATAGNVAADAVTATAGALLITAAAGDIDVGATTSGGAIALSALDIDLTGKADATGAASLTATTGDISSTTVLDVEGASITLAGAVKAATQVLLNAVIGDLTVTGGIVTGTGDVTISARQGKITVDDIATPGDVSLVGGALDIVGTVVAQGKAFLQALTGNVVIRESVTAVGGALVLDAANGDGVINRIAALDDISVNVADLDLSGSISAGDTFELTSGRTGETIVLGGDGSASGVTLRRAAGLTIDANELTRISAGQMILDAGANDVLLSDVAFAAAILDALILGADTSSRIFAAGTVTGLSSLQLGFTTNAVDRRPELILVSGQLGLDSATGRLGAVRLESSGDIIIGTEAFLDLWESQIIGLNLLGAPPPSVFGTTAGHVFVATDKLQLQAPGSIVQLNTGSGVDGAGLVIGVPGADDGLLFPDGAGPEEVVLFGVVVRTDGTRVSSFEAGLENNLLFPGGGTPGAPALKQNGNYRWNLCLIGDPVSCSSDLLRDAERFGRLINNDPAGIGGGIPLVFETGEDDERDEEEDLGGVAASGNEALWDASAR